MMDVVPNQIDGAIVFDLQNKCKKCSMTCDDCSTVVIWIHNWLKQTQLDYVVVDLQDEKEICPSFIEELMQLRKRLGIPFLFAGVMEKPQKLLESFNYGESYPLFITPEDAVRALRIQHPGVTEAPIRHSIDLGHSLSQAWRNSQLVLGF